jgi:L-asparagine transporter-like permease
MPFFRHGYCVSLLVMVIVLLCYMASEDQRRMLFARTAALIVVMYAFLFNRIRMHQNSRPQICYGPLRVKDEEWKKT